MKACKDPGKHIWEPLKGGKRERCRLCGAIFPCYNQCEHLDCIEARGEEFPSWGRVIALESSQDDKEEQNEPEETE